MSTLQRLNGKWMRQPFTTASRFGSQSSLSHTIVNDRLYAHPSSKPVIAITIDGCDVRHLNQSIECDYMPNIRDMITPTSHTKLGSGYMCPVSTVFPTCSRTNQVSIATGSTPDFHGIVGDYCIDGDITDSDSLFADSILTELSHDNITVLLMTLNEEYREQLSYDFHPNSTSLSLELLTQFANNTTNNNNDNALIEAVLKDNQIFNRLKQLSVYFESENKLIQDIKGECSLYLLEIMSKVLENPNIETPHLNYIALSPATLQYYHDHRSPEMMQYLGQIDEYLKLFNDYGARYGVTSSHGTNYKLGAKGDLFIINIEQKINDCWNLYGKELEMDIFSMFEYKIILQKNATDILYGFVHIHIIEKDKDIDIEFKKKLIFHTLGYMRDIKGIYSSIGHEESCLSLELPSERIGDVLLLGDIDTIFCDNNLNEKQLKENNVKEWRLSNGCLDESTVSLILNERPTDKYLTMLNKGKGRNYHLFDILLNGYDESLQEHCPYTYTPSKYQYIGK